MNTLPPSRTSRKQHGFTLVEMIGVLAVIAILASLLVPRIFQAINDSKVSNAAAACNTVKSAVNEYYGKKGRFEDGTGAPLTATTEGWQSVLLKERFLEKPLDVRIGTNATLRVVNVGTGLAVDTAPVAAGLTIGAYDLDGAGDANDIMNSGWLAELSIGGVTVQDARDLSLRLDGKELSTAEGSATAEDSKGRVKYSVDSGVADVHVYIAHR